MTQLTTRCRFVLSAVAALALTGCFHEEFSPYRPYGSSTSGSSGSSGTSGTSGSETATDTSTGTTEAVEAEPEPVRSCAAPEGVPPSLPVDLALELDPQASGSCPTSWCVENVSCGLCCNGEYPTLGTTECCTNFGNQRAPNSAGQCGGSGLIMKCVWDTPDPPNGPRRTPVPTSCVNGTDWTCPGGSHPESPNFECTFCQDAGSPCGFNNTCSLCEG